MYPSPRDSPSRPILPEELDMLGAVFEQLLGEYQLTVNSDQAEALAARLIELYQSGVRDVTALRAMAKLF